MGKVKLKTTFPVLGCIRTASMSTIQEKLARSLEVLSSTTTTKSLGSRIKFRPDMKEVPFVPCPVRLGTVISAGPAAQLHKYTRERNMKKLEKLIMKGVDVDCVNNLGQSPLFCACLLGFSSVVELLLQYGADPNHRCEDRSTPVHAAVFSCNPWLLSCLLDAGGDLRLHDDQGRTPKDWAKAGGQERSPKMLGFLKRCESHMWSLSQTLSPRARNVTPTSSKSFLKNSSVMDFLRSGDSNLHVNKSYLSKVVQCFGYGKLCIEKSEQLVGLSASVPLITDSELSQTKDEALHSFTSGSFSCMTNYIWKGCWVTVKELQQSAKQKGCLDLLITEMEYCCHLFHPHLLQLMAVCISFDLKQHRLVYERVHVGSLYNVLHYRQTEYPVPRVWELLTVVVQVCEALLYLHGRDLVLRALSSHSVLIVYPGVAKVTDLGFMVPSEGRCLANVRPLPVPGDLYNWAAPEAIMGRTCTGKTDIYSVGAIIQELYTDAVPWGSTDPDLIKQAVQTGQALPANPAVPQPYYQLLQNCLQPQAQDRTSSIHEIQYTLWSDLKEIKEREMKRSEEFSQEAGLSVPGWSLNIEHYREPELPDQPHSGQQGLTEVSGGSTLNPEITEQRVNTSQHNPLFLEECGPSQLHKAAKTTSRDDLMLSSRSVKEETQDSFSISEHIGSIVLNLKVSQVLLQQIESSLVKAELITNMHTHDQLHSGGNRDEVGGLSRKGESGVEVLNAVGPPSTYIPLLELREAEAAALGLDVIKYEMGSSDEEEATWDYPSGEESNVGGACFSDTSEDQLENNYKNLLPSQPANTMWTTDVGETVEQMARGEDFGTSAGPLGSRVSEHHCNIYQRQQRTTHEYAALEQMPNFAEDDQHMSEETTDFHAFSQTFSIPSSVLEPTESDKKSHSEDEDEEEEDEDELDITMGVCHPLDCRALKAALMEYRSAYEDQDQSGAECSKPTLRCVSPTSHMQDPADTSEISSFVCSPALRQKWSGHNGTPPSPQSGHLTPCNSTPRCQSCRTENLEDEDMKSEGDSSASERPIFTSDLLPGGVSSSLVPTGADGGDVLREQDKECKEQSVGDHALESDAALQIEKKNVLSGHPGSLEETTRASSTLDKALQASLVGDMEQQKPSGCYESIVEFCEDGKVKEGYFTEDVNMEAAGKEMDVKAALGSGNTKTHEKNVGAAHTGPFRPVHRVIVLEDTAE